MKKFYIRLLASLLPAAAFAQKDHTKLVNPFIGTGGHGHTYPGASMPFGMMQLGPDTRMADWDGSSGYHYSDSVIYGFSHTHLSGTGIPDYCDVLFMPFTGSTPWSNKDYRSGFSHRNEKAEPGYYEVLLDRQQIRARLTTSVRSGMHQYIFPASAKQGNILIDLKHRDEVLESWVEKVSDHELRGLRRSRSWARDQYLYFYVRSEQPIRSFTVLNDEGKEVSDAHVSGKNLRISLGFDLDAKHQLQVKVGISGVSADGAKANLDTEIPGWNFEKLRSDAHRAWNKELGVIDVSGGSKDEQTCFYTALYHCFLVPNVYEDVDGQYRGTDLKPHRAEGFTNYSVFSLWDTYRAYNPLMTIIDRKRMRDWIYTFLNQYKNGGMLPVWELSGNETFCMIGYHSVPVIVNAYCNGIRDFDAKLALEAMCSYAESNRFGLDAYRRQGFISNDLEHESASKTLEYAYDDWCIAQFARMTGNDSVYHRYIRRAQSYKNLFDPQTHNMRGKVQGMFYSPFDPKEINNFYTEGNSWHYSFAVPQDVETLIGLHGGPEAFAAKLDELFTTSSQTTGRDQADVTGLIGQYAQGNEPSHHMAYLYAFAGQPWKTQELIHRICKDLYRNSPDGLIGNEDCGQMSAWYVLSALGFYSVCPGNDEYVLGTPLFDQAVIHLENGKQFVVKTKRSNKDAFYIAGAWLNGQTFTNAYLSNDAVMNGGSLELSLAAEPQKQWGSSVMSRPHARIADDPIVPVPFFDGRSNKFHDSLRVVISDIDPHVSISCQIGDGPKHTYTGSFVIDSSCTLTAYAEKSGQSSQAVTQRFYRLPSDRSITVMSKVSSMYTAGGPDALIDGIEGTTNWRAGEWQSYYNQDFEAVVDLRQVRPLHHLGIHVLQEVSPWIIYPKEVIFSVSDDGINYREAVRVANRVPVKLSDPEMQELGADVDLRARYVRIKAINGGHLPDWHESAGNPSHLFIDELIVR